MPVVTSNVKKWFLLAVPLVLGAAGFLLAGEAFLNALFYAVCLYALNVQDAPPNLLVELARWTAPIATASGLLLAFASLRNRIRNELCYRRGNSVAVYGPENERIPFLAALGDRGIDGEERFVRAQCYVLLDGEEENFSFYQRNRERLLGRTVYLRCSSVRPQSSADPELRLFSPEETAARLFWKEHCLYEESCRRGHRLSVVLIGFGKLGEEVLLYALQDNLFHPDQEITYHIFGDGAAFSSIHGQLGQLRDPVIFHDGPWYGSLPLIEEAAAVLVVEQEAQTALADQLLLATGRERFFVFSADETSLALLSGGNRLTLYPWRELSRRPEYILGDTLYDRAKRINLRYASLYGGTEENEQAKEAEWRKLDGFTRYSNISSADYHEIQLRMLEIMGEPADAARMSPACLELLAELEHIRWCRYHWLNNWRFGTPENGKRKDPERRIHADLVPYESLSEAEKEKDRENIRVLFSVE